MFYVAGVVEHQQYTDVPNLQVVDEYENLWWDVDKTPPIWCDAEGPPTIGVHNLEYSAGVGVGGASSVVLGSENVEPYLKINDFNDEYEGDAVSYELTYQTRVPNETVVKPFGTTGGNAGWYTRAHRVVENRDGFLNVFQGDFLVDQANIRQSTYVYSILSDATGYYIPEDATMSIGNSTY